jgi:nitroimidazol reductase NimA-like FMN-containing flavoprotein (pyridoxamine 5'-phosphate oxidase superfamily)
MSPHGDPGIEILDRDECLRLLGSVPVGRVAFTTGALPSVQPVTFVLHGDQVVFRTSPGTKLDAALHDVIVAFEVDEFDVVNRAGWSVTAVGTAIVVADPELLDELSRLPLDPWAPGRREHFVTISVTIVNGRRIATNGHQPSGTENGQRSPAVPR